MAGEQAKTRREESQADTDQQSGGGWRLSTRVTSHGLAIKITIVAVVVLVVLLLKWGIGAAFLLGLFVASAFNSAASWLSIGAALLCIASCPLLIVAEQHAWLQQSSLVNYYAASIGVYSFNNAVDTVLPTAFYLLCIGLVGRVAVYITRDKKYDRVSNEAT